MNKNKERKKRSLFLLFNKKTNMRILSVILIIIFDEKVSQIKAVEIQFYC